MEVKHTLIHVWLILGAHVGHGGQGLDHALDAHVPHIL